MCVCQQELFKGIECSVCVCVCTECIVYMCVHAQHCKTIDAAVKESREGVCA